MVVMAPHENMPPSAGRMLKQEPRSKKIPKSKAKVKPIKIVDIETERESGGSVPRMIKPEDAIKIRRGDIWHKVARGEDTDINSDDVTDNDSDETEQREPSRQVSSDVPRIKPITEGGVMIWPCPECGKRYRLQSGLTKHLRKGCLTATWRCEWCEKGLKDSKGRSPGPNGPSTLCTKCGTLYRHGYLTKPKLNAKGIYECAMCEDTFESLRGLSGHRRYCNGKIWNCEWCSSKKSKKRGEGPNGPDTLCYLCTQRYKKGFTGVPQPIDENGNLLCELCQKSFTAYRPLVVHQRTCTGGKWRCSWCEIKESKARGRADGPDGPGTLCTTCHTRFQNGFHGPPERDPEDNKFICSGCGMKFDTMRGLGSHARGCSGGTWRCEWCDADEKTSRGKSPGPSGSKTLCSRCGARYRNGQREPVARAENGDFICNRCSKTYDSMVRLSGHRRFCDGGAWRCAWCHVDANDGGGKGPGPDGPRTLCSACSSRFRSGHEGPPPKDANGRLYCVDCEKRFDTISGLGSHRRFCTKEIKFSKSLQLVEDLTLGGGEVALPTKPASVLPMEVVGDALQLWATYAFLARFSDHYADTHVALLKPRQTVLRTRLEQIRMGKAASLTDWDDVEKLFLMDARTAYQSSKVHAVHIFLVNLLFLDIANDAEEGVETFMRFHQINVYTWPEMLRRYLNMVATEAKKENHRIVDAPWDVGKVANWLATTHLDELTLKQRIKLLLLTTSLALETSSVRSYVDHCINTVAKAKASSKSEYTQARKKIQERSRAGALERARLRAEKLAAAEASRTTSQEAAKNDKNTKDPEIIDATEVALYDKTPTIENSTNSHNDDESADESKAMNIDGDATDKQNANHGRSEHGDVHRDKNVDPNVGGDNQSDEDVTSGMSEDKVRTESMKRGRDDENDSSASKKKSKKLKFKYVSVEEALKIDHDAPTADIAGSANATDADDNSQPNPKRQPFDAKKIQTRRKEEANLRDEIQNKLQREIDNTSFRLIRLGLDRNYNSYYVVGPSHARLWIQRLNGKDESWLALTTIGEIEALLDSLRRMGERESKLRKALVERRPRFAEDMAGPSRNGDSETKEDPDNKIGGGGEDGQESDSISSVTATVGSVTISDNNVEDYGAVSGVSALATPANDAKEVEVTINENRQKYESPEPEVVSKAFDYSSIFKSNASCFLEKEQGVAEMRCGYCQEPLDLTSERHCYVCHATFKIAKKSAEEFDKHVQNCKKKLLTSDGKNLSQPDDQLPLALLCLKGELQDIDAAVSPKVLKSWGKVERKAWAVQVKQAKDVSSLENCIIELISKTDRKCLGQDWKDWKELADAREGVDWRNPSDIDAEIKSNGENEEECVKSKTENVDMSKSEPDTPPSVWEVDGSTTNDARSSKDDIENDIKDNFSVVESKQLVVENPSKKKNDSLLVVEGMDTSQKLTKTVDNLDDEGVEGTVASMSTNPEQLEQVDEKEITDTPALKSADVGSTNVKSIPTSPSIDTAKDKANSSTDKIQLSARNVHEKDTEQDSEDEPIMHQSTNKPFHPNAKPLWRKKKWSPKKVTSAARCLYWIAMFDSVAPYGIDYKPKPVKKRKSASSDYNMDTLTRKKK